MVTWQQIAQGEPNPFDITRTSTDGYTASYDEYVITDQPTIDLPSPQQDAAVAVRADTKDRRVAVSTPSGSILDIGSEAYYEGPEPAIFVSDGVDWYVQNDEQQLGAATPDYGDYQWYIDAGSGSTLDADVGSVTATTSGGPTWVSDSSAVGGYHLSHDGVDDTWRTDSNVLTTPFTVAGWTRFDDMGDFENYCMWNGSDNSNGDRIALYTAGSGLLDVIQEGGSMKVDQDYPTAGNWGFWALNVTDTDFRLITWSNSTELSDKTTGNQNDNYPSSYDLVVGRDTNDEKHLTGDTDFYVVSEGTLLTKSELTELWEKTQR